MVRVRVELPAEEKTDQIQAMSVQKFGQNFVDKVANPQDILAFTKARRATSKSGKQNADAVDDEDWPGSHNTAQDRVTIMDVLRQKLCTEDMKILQVCSTMHAPVCTPYAFNAWMLT